MERATILSPSTPSKTLPDIISEVFLATLRTHGVKTAHLFGSFARGEERPESDIDLLVTFARPTTLFQQMDLTDALSRLTGRRVDLMTRIEPAFAPTSCRRSSTCLYNEVGAAQTDPVPLIVPRVVSRIIGGEEAGMAHRYRDRRTARFAAGQPVKAFDPIAKQINRRLTMLESADSLHALASYPSNHFEALRGDRAGQYSIRINDQWRICFEWPDDETGAMGIEIVDYH